MSNLPDFAPLKKKQEPLTFKKAVVAAWGLCGSERHARPDCSCFWKCCHRMCRASWSGFDSGEIWNVASCSPRDSLSLYKCCISTFPHRFCESLISWKYWDPDCSHLKGKIWSHHQSQRISGFDCSFSQKCSMNSLVQWYKVMGWFSSEGLVTHLPSTTKHTTHPTPSHQGLGKVSKIPPR